MDLALDYGIILKKNPAKQFIDFGGWTLFQKTIERILCKKSQLAMNMFKNNNNKNVFVIAGGVASNNAIIEKLSNLSIENNFEPIFPSIKLCSDNAAMIAWAGIERFRLGLLNKLDFPARARWALDEKAPFLKGSGIKIPN